MPVPIRAGVFVPEADHVSELVDDYAEFVAVLSYGNCLRSSTTFAYEGTAAKKNKSVFILI